MAGVKVRRRRRAEGVIGLDLSLRAAAAAWLPRGWTGDTKQVIVKHWGSKLKADASLAERIERNCVISEGVLAFCTEHRPQLIAFENYAFSAQSSSVTKLAELGGIVRADLHRTLRIPLAEVTASSARKLMLQRVPRKDSKQWTEDNVRRLGGDALYWTGDEVDAVVVANAGADAIGWVPVSFPGIP